MPRAKASTMPTTSVVISGECCGIGLRGLVRRGPPGRGRCHRWCKGPRPAERPRPRDAEPWPWSNRLLKHLRRLEAHRLARLDLHRLALAGVQALPRLGFRHPEGAEA